MELRRLQCGGQEHEEALPSLFCRPVSPQEYYLAGVIGLLKFVYVAGGSPESKWRGILVKSMYGSRCRPRGGKIVLPSLYVLSISSSISCCMGAGMYCVLSAQVRHHAPGAPTFSDGHKQD